MLVELGLAEAQGPKLPRDGAAGVIAEQNEPGLAVRVDHFKRRRIARNEQVPTRIACHCMPVLRGGAIDRIGPQA
jgi:hypothetical protein